MHSRRTSARRKRSDIFITFFAVIAFLTITSGYYYFKFQSKFKISPARIPLTIEKHKPHPCDVIHIGMVCLTPKSKLQMYTMLKSLFHHRKSNPIQFHIVVEQRPVLQLENSLSKLFETWALPEVEVKFYNLELVDPINEYITSPSMLRFMLPILRNFRKPSKMILLSTDIIFYSDIFELWNEFQYFRENQILGIPTNNAKDNERGFAEVALYHLDNLHKYGLDKILDMLKDLRNSKYDTHTEMKLIFTNMAKLKLAYPLECSWNAYRDTECVLQNKVLHHEILGQNDLLELMKFDGNTVRKRNYNCYVLPTLEKVKRPMPDKCSSFPESEIQQKRTLLYFYDYKKEKLYSDVVTLVTQLSLDQFDLLENIAMRWKGPMSVTFYLTDEELIDCTKYLKGSYILKARLNTGYHVVFKYGEYFHSTYLRNVALNEVQTPYVISIDVNEVPMENLYPVLIMYFTNFPNMTKKALVVPSFEAKNPWAEIPSTKEDVLEMLQQKKVFIAKEHSTPEALVPTDYAKWKSATKPYKVTWETNYEPYVVVKSDVVRYDERFFAHGWDQVSYAMELKAQGYEFYVFPKAFVVSDFYKNSRDKTYLISSKVKMCLKAIQEEVAQDLKNKYGQKVRNDLKKTEI